MFGSQPHQSGQNHAFQTLGTLILWVGWYGFNCVSTGGITEGNGINAGKIAWKFKDRAFAYASSPAVTKDRLVVGCRDKRLHCLDRKTGKRLWAFRTRGKVDSSPVIADGKVIVGSDDGNLYVVSLEDGKKLWSFEIGEAVIAAPAVASGTIVIGAEDGRVYAFGSAN